MHTPPDILSLAYKQTLMQDQLVLLQEREQQIPGSVQYVINRYRRNPQWNIEDTGMLVYHYAKNSTRKITWNSGFVSVVMYIVEKKTQNVICASSVHPKHAWNG